MVASRGAVLVALVAASLTLVACDALLGLDGYHDISPCESDCGSGGISPGSGDAADTGKLTDAGDATTADAARDAPPEADVITLGEGSVPDSGWPTPTAHELWAHWPMPNPDAAVAPDSSVRLPNQMAYDAGADGGSAVVYDEVTGLTWNPTSLPATSYDNAWMACLALAPAPRNEPWRVPTRIELVSLIDFTQPSGQPTVDPAVFPQVIRTTYWTSSALPGDSGPPSTWAVDFTTGLTGVTPGNDVLCVSGGTQ